MAPCGLARGRERDVGFVFDEEVVEGFEVVEGGGGSEVEDGGEGVSEDEVVVCAGGVLERGEERRSVGGKEVQVIPPGELFRVVVDGAGEVGLGEEHSVEPVNAALVPAAPSVPCLPHARPEGAPPQLTLSSDNPTSRSASSPTREPARTAHWGSAGPHRRHPPLHPRSHPRNPRRRRSQSHPPSTCCCAKTCPCPTSSGADRRGRGPDTGTRGWRRRRTGAVSWPRTSARGRSSRRWRSWGPGEGVRRGWRRRWCG